MGVVYVCTCTQRRRQRLIVHAKHEENPGYTCRPNDDEDDDCTKVQWLRLDSNDISIAHHLVTYFEIETASFVFFPLFSSLLDRNKDQR